MARNKGGDSGQTPSRVLSTGQREYEMRRAKEAGVSLEAWMARKARAAAAAVPAEGRPPAKTRRSLFAKLLDRAHRPL